MRPARSIKQRITMLLLITLAAVSGAVPAGAGPTPDFVHPATPHKPGFTPAWGMKSRPLLLIYERWNDRTIAVERTERWAADRIMGDGGFFDGGVPHYFEQNSRGKLRLTPAPEWNGIGNNGVIVINAGKANDDRVRPNPARADLALTLASTHLDFQAFDTNRDGAVTRDELGILLMHESRSDEGQPVENCGKTIRPSAGLILDSVKMQVSVAGFSADANQMTAYHEAAHMLLDAPDLYAFGTGRVDLMGPTCAIDNENIWSIASWMRMHLGWDMPQIVTRDGYYDISQWSATGQSYLLYDPARGGSDYLLVENRQTRSVGYETWLPDEGLAIWRIDESASLPENGEHNMRRMELVSPPGGEMWDSSDPSTPERTMQAPWRDGTPSRVAVRGISARGDTMRAYFDVPGPGVLVEPQPGMPRLRSSANEITLGVMNTGETTDTFDVTLDALPAGWSAPVIRVTLAAGSRSTVAIPVTWPGWATGGEYTLRAKAWSTSDPSVASDSPQPMFLDHNIVAVWFDHLPRLEWATPGLFTTSVTHEGAPVAGASVEVRITWAEDGQGEQAPAEILQGRTDTQGIARIPWDGAPRPGDYLATATCECPQDNVRSDMQRLTVDRRKTMLRYDGELEGQYSDPMRLSATLTEASTGAPISDQLVVITIGDHQDETIPVAATSAAGIASLHRTLNVPAGSTSVHARFPGNALYDSVEVEAEVQVAPENAFLEYTGPAQATIDSAALSARVVEEHDGHPGALDEAEVVFELIPTLGGQPVHASAAVAADGTAATVVQIPSDLYSVRVTLVPSAPGAYTGQSEMTELAIVDQSAAVQGTGRGIGRDGANAVATLRGKYSSGRPGGHAHYETRGFAINAQTIEWIVVRNGRAIVQARRAGHGGACDQCAVIPTAIRLTVADATHGNGFSAVLRDANGVVLHDSGWVALRNGRFIVS